MKSFNQILEKIGWSLIVFGWVLNIHFFMMGHKNYDKKDYPKMFEYSGLAIIVAPLGSGMGYAYAIEEVKRYYKIDERIQKSKVIIVEDK